MPAISPTLEVPFLIESAPPSASVTAKDVPHIAFPLRLAEAQLAEVEQDELDDVRQCVHVLLVTPIGTRPLAPDIGVEDPTFDTGVDAQALTRTLEDQEDRATVTVTTTPTDETGTQQVQVFVDLASTPVDTI